MISSCRPLVILFLFQLCFLFFFILWKDFGILKVSDEELNFYKFENQFQKKALLEMKANMSRMQEQILEFHKRIQSCEEKTSSDLDRKPIGMQKTLNDFPIYLQKYFPPSMPKILILTPLKEYDIFIKKYYQLVISLRYPHDLISFGFLESEWVNPSVSLKYLMLFENLTKEFRSVKFYHINASMTSLIALEPPTNQHKHSIEYQSYRRSVLARCRNYLLAKALDDEDFVLWIDADLDYYPPDIIETLLSTEKDIVVPACMFTEGNNQIYDLNTFVGGNPELINKIFGSNGLIFNGYNFIDRKTLVHFRPDTPRNGTVEVDGVGGTMLLIRADLHREGLIFPPFNFERHIETEGLAFMARKMGYKCWGMPHVEIWHGP